MRKERGAVLPLMAILFVILIGTVAMAVDLGWLFWQSVEIQHGADAAALAGVIYEPDQRAEAHAAGIAAAAENGFVDTSLGGSDTVEIIDFIDDPTVVEHDNQLRATITHSVPTFFIKVFGINSVDIKRTAVAQYNLPLFLGSPEAHPGRYTWSATRSGWLSRGAAAAHLPRSFDLGKVQVPGHHHR